MTGAGVVIIVRDGHPECRVVRLDKGKPVVIGRGAQCDVVIHDQQLSAAHCEITFHSDVSWAVHDLSSHNGTFLDNQRVGKWTGEAYLLRAGNSLMLLEADISRFATGPTIVDCDAVYGPRMRAVLARVRAHAVADEPMLLVGPNGVGKYWSFVRRYCEYSPRRSFPFVSTRWVDREDDLLSLLCGAAGCPGGRSQLVAATGGILCLDAVERLSADVQGHVFRLMTQGEVVPVGGYQPIQTDVRVIATCEGDLVSAVESGAFRRDLHDLLTRNAIDVPPTHLREEEVPYLAALEIRDALRRSQKPRPPMTAAAYAELMFRAPDSVLGIRAAAYQAATSALIAGAPSVFPRHVAEALPDG